MKCRSRIERVEDNWSDTTNNNCSNHLKEAIDANKPVFVGAAGHATVAFAYDDNYVYVHSRWEDIRRTPWAAYDTNFFDFFGGPHTVDVTVFSTNHYYSDTYFSTFLNQYFFYDKSLDVNVGNYTFNTKRLRTGYI